jgi:hypothetical protein
MFAPILKSNCPWLSEPDPLTTTHQCPAVVFFSSSSCSFFLFFFSSSSSSSSLLLPLLRHLRFLASFLNQVHLASCLLPHPPPFMSGGEGNRCICTRATGCAMHKRGPSIRELRECVVERALRRRTHTLARPGVAVIRLHSIVRQWLRPRDAEE